MRRWLSVPIYGLACYLLGKSLRWMDDQHRATAAYLATGILVSLIPDVEPDIDPLYSVPYQIGDPTIVDGSTSGVVQ